jgi:hypothetical protein
VSPIGNIRSTSERQACLTIDQLMVKKNRRPTYRKAMAAKIVYEIDMALMKIQEEKY